jgi:hypothetical protein
MIIMVLNLCLAACFGMAGIASACAQSAEGDAALGRVIIKENECNGACHQKAVKGADPVTLYTRTIRKVNSPEELRRQVDLCISFLNAPIFPEDAAHVVTALDRDAYHFD